MCLLLTVSAMAGGLMSVYGDTGSDQDRTTPLVVFEGFDVDILGAYAVTETVRVLENPNDGPMNHTFRFSIPEGALISNFSIEVEGQVYYADVLEKEEAQEQYNESVQEGNTAGLVASTRDADFEYSVSFAPEERITATLRYEQMLLKTLGWHEYVLPIDASSYVDEVGTFDIYVDVEAPGEIAELVHEGYDTLVKDSVVGSSTAQVHVMAEDIVPDEDLVVRWRTDGGSPAGVMYFGTFEGEGYFLHVYDPDPSLLGDERLGKDFVFVLDKSGSMDGTKFEQSKEALTYIYSNLIPEDRFSLVEFNSLAHVYSEDLIPVDNGSIETVLAYISGLFAGGSTNIHEGIIDGLDIFKAHPGSVPIMVLLTDGRANTGLYHRSEFRKDVLEKNTVEAPIFGIALGYGADWDLVNALSLESDGRAIWVMEEEDVVAAISEFVDSFSTPLVSNLRFDYGPGVTDVHPSEVRAHYDGSEVLVAGRFSDLTEIPMELTAITGSGETVTTGIFPVDAVPAHDYVPRFWAFSKIQDLEDRMVYNGTDDATVKEITDLALRFHFVTDHTSLFVELPEDIQERFEDGGYPQAEGSSPELAYGRRDSYSGPTSNSYFNTGPQTLGAAPMTGTGQPQSGSQPVNDPAQPPQGSTSNDAVKDGSGGSSHPDQDNDGTVHLSTTDPQGNKRTGALPDIEESYSPLPSVIVDGAHEGDGGGALSSGTYTSEAEEDALTSWSVMAIAMIPIATLLAVALHWFALGRHRVPRRRT